MPPIRKSIETVSGNASSLGAAAGNAVAGAASAISSLVSPRANSNDSNNSAESTNSSESGTNPESSSNQNVSEASIEQFYDDYQAQQFATLDNFKRWQAAYGGNNATNDALMKALANQKPPKAPSSSSPPKSSAPQNRSPSPKKDSDIKIPKMDDSGYKKSLEAIKKEREKLTEESKAEKKDTRKLDELSTDLNKLGSPIPHKPISNPHKISGDLASKVANDAARMTYSDGTSSKQELAQARSKASSLLGQYQREINQGNLKLNEDDLRRLITHGVDPASFKEAQKQNPGLNNKFVTSKAITARNQELIDNHIKNNPEDKDIYKFLEDQGFKKDELHQLSGKQFIQMYQDYKEGKQDDKKALVLLPSNRTEEFDMARELADLKRLGHDRVFFRQVDSEDELKQENNGKAGSIKKLAQEVGGFDTLALGGHGKGKKGAGINFGEYDKTDPISEIEKSYLNPGDFKNDPEIKALFQDREVFKEGLDIASCSCNFTGSKDIKADESMAAAIKEVRPDANVFGPKGDVDVHGGFYNNKDGELAHTSAEEFELASIDKPEIVDTAKRLDSLDIDFDEEEATEEDIEEVEEAEIEIEEPDIDLEDIE